MAAISVTADTLVVALTVREKIAAAHGDMSEVVSTAVSTSGPSERSRSWSDMVAVDEHQAKSYELAFEEAGRALDAQERAVNELRSRAGC